MVWLLVVIFFLIPSHQQQHDTSLIKLVPTKTITLDDEYDDNAIHWITLHHPYHDKQQELTYPQNENVMTLSSSSKNNNNIEIQPNMFLIIPQKTQKQGSDDPWNVSNYD